jgi:trimeric autotransporter adhesin
MAFSGGTYTLPGAALNTGDTVSATENNTFRNDMATAFNLTWLRNGTATATANIPMGTYKFTGLGNGTASGDSIAYGQTADAVIYGLTIGRGAGSVSTNTAVGASALSANTSGDRCTAVGSTAGASNTTGIIDAFGSNALTANTTGNYNKAFGESALRSNTTGSTNNAFGGSALRSNTTASDNSAFGESALRTNTTGASNTAVGSNALYSNTTALNNTAVGYQAGYSNTTAAYNTFVGAKAGYNSTGSSNAFFGDESGYSVTTGIQNTFLGQAAGYSVTTGSKNTIIGEYTGNQGGLDIRTASGYIVLSDGDGNPRGVFNDSGFFKAYKGAGWNGLTGFGHEFTNDVDSSTLHAYASNTSYTSNIIYAISNRNTTNGTYKAFAYYNSSVSAYKFYVIDSGAIYSTSTSITSISDQRFKENIQDIDVGLSQVMQLKPRRFDWKEDQGENRKGAVGFIAQEVQEVMPDLVTHFKTNDEETEEYLGIRSQDLIPTLVKAIQELKADLDATKAELAAMKGQA